MTAHTDKLNKKFADKLARKQWQLDNAEGFKRLENAVIVGDEVKRNSCFGAAVSLFVIGASLVSALIVAVLQ